MNPAAIRGKEKGLPDQEIERLFLDNYDFLYRAAYRILRNPNDAEDVVQNLFLKLIQSGYVPETNAKGYLRQSAVNEAVSMIRSRKRRKEDESIDDVEMVAPGDGRIWDNISGPLQDALAILKPEAADILLLRYVHGYSDAEIAKMFGTSRGKIAMILNRSRAKLQELLGGSNKKEVKNDDK